MIDADNDGVENFVFDEFPDCVDELNNCQWQVIYHGLTSDAISVLSEPCFTSISLQAEQWTDLVRELPDNMTLVETIQDFAVEDLCPQLYRLVPLLENTLQLRSLMYQKDMELSKVLYHSFLDTHREVIEQNRLLEPITAELQRCGQLIRKVELEEELLRRLERDAYVPLALRPNARCAGPGSRPQRLRLSGRVIPCLPAGES